MKKKVILALILPLAGLFSCSTDFNLNADWKDIAIVYGLLNQADTIQYIKLNKGFLGEDDAYVMATEVDSIFYDSAEVYLEPMFNNQNLYDNSGNKIRIKLIENYDIIKDSGIFANEFNLIYSTTSQLNINYDYKLIVEIPGKEPIVSTTQLIDDFPVIRPANIPGQKINFFIGQTQEYIDYDVEFKPNEVGELYGVTMRFKYREIGPDGQNDYYIDWVQPTKRRPATVDVNTEMVITLNGSNFFSFIANKIEQGDPSIKRVALGADFVFMVGGKDLALYIEVNSPSEGIIQERPAFTNIENGIGVFSSRFTKTISNKEFGPLTLDELSCGEATKHLRFADSNGNFDCLTK